MLPLNAWLNNVSLQGLDGRILVQNIPDNAPQTELLYGDNPGRSGQRWLARRRVNRRVSVVFAIRELRDLAARAAILDRVNGWAQDGVLQISNRPGQQLRVLCAGRAAMMTPRDYREEFTIDFDAAASPFWEDRVAQMLRLTGTGGSGSILNRGTADALAAVTVTPTGGTLQTLTITLGAYHFALSGLNVAQGVPLRIGYDERGYLYIKTSAASLLACRSDQSTDDLMAAPGYNEVSFTASTACQVETEVRGTWL